MARPRAADHEEKRQAILQNAAELFAVHGFDRASLNMLATACGMSKALLYHYYSDKAQLLFDIIHTHLQHLLAVTDLPPGAAEADPKDHLVRLANALLEAYRSAATMHHIQINQLPLLPADQQQALKGLERNLVDRFAEAIASCLPALAHDQPGLLKPLTMSLFGMLNWNYLWFKESGSMSRGAYAALAVTLVIDGVERFGEKMPASSKPLGKRRFA